MARRSGARYGPTAIALHWAVAALFLAQIAFGTAMLRVADLGRQFTMIQWHKSIGFLILALASVRLAWRLTGGRRAAEPEPADVADRLARAVHVLLLALTLLVPLAGWALASASPLDIPSYAFNLVVVPHLPLPKSDAGEAFFAWSHALLAWSAGVLALGHAGAALWHHAVLKDDVLRRMLGSHSGAGRR